MYDNLTKVYNMAVFNKALINVLCITFLLCTFNAAASDDEYMKLLEAEAEESVLDQTGQRESNDTLHNNITKKNWVGECDYIDDILPLGLVWEEFSSYLKQCSLSTFAFYRRLDMNLQRSVYENYSKSASAELNVLRQEILKHY